jgi:hypothetical protein
MRFATELWAPSLETERIRTTLEILVRTGVRRKEFRWQPNVFNIWKFRIETSVRKGTQVLLPAKSYSHQEGDIQR